ncbi:MAG TPA: hypothetical protein VM243_20260 [Phycisphaerae bacterium]|nr:hypothetical protein [Phycisphaerae bacterium]
MRWRTKCVWKILALIPMLGLYNLASCQADVMRDVAKDLDDRAGELDGQDDDLDLGDYLADLVDGL